tara:strand:+ start:205 stop:381 length:177 start_codon:yes stop_codon:yes gene_type:complete
MARDLLGETRAFVLKWRSDRGLEGTKALPNRNELPYQWMAPFLNKVQANKDKLKIGTA